MRMLDKRTKYRPILAGFVVGGQLPIFCASLYKTVMICKTDQDHFDSLCHNGMHFTKTLSHKNVPLRLFLLIARYVPNVMRKRSSH